MRMVSFSGYPELHIYSSDVTIYLLLCGSLLRCFLGAK